MNKIKIISLIILSVSIFLLQSAIFAETINAPYLDDVHWLMPFQQTVGLYSFDYNLNDLSGHSNNLIGVNIDSSNFVAGEDFWKSICINVVRDYGPNPHPNSQFGYISHENANDFDMGMSDFTVEIITKPLKGDPYRRGMVCKKENYSITTPGWELELANAGTEEIPYDVLMDLSDGVNCLHQHWGDVNRYNGRWIYIAVVVDRKKGQMQLYLDGKPHGDPIDISFITGEISNPTKDFSIARHISDPHHDYTGLIDEVCITKKALTSDEIWSRNPHSNPVKIAVQKK